jgi:RHS repeat-associated protein
LKMNTQLSYNYYTHATQNPENFGWLSGYTEHKHLDEFALINMFSEDFDFVSISETKSLAELIPIATVWSVSGNGRIYDPELGRMLSPDNYVQSPYNSQSYNRYSYVWNNPLKYTDPSGEWVNFAIGAVVGGYTGYKIGRAKGARREQLFYYTVGGAAIGVATAGIGSYVNGAVAGGVGGSATSVGAISAGTAGLASGFFAGVSYSFLAGADPKEALIAGAKSAAISGVSAALIGGMIAYSNDMNFWTGRNIAMGRGYFALKNTDIPPNKYRGLNANGKSDHFYNYEYYRGVLDGTRQGANFNRMKWQTIDSDGMSTGAQSELYNYTLANHGTRVYNVESFKGRADFQIIDNSSHNVSINIDGNVVVPDNSGYLPIYEGSKTLTISVTRNQQSLFFRVESSLKFTIIGFAP